MKGRANDLDETRVSESSVGEKYSCLRVALNWAVVMESVLRGINCGRRRRAGLDVLYVGVNYSRAAVVRHRCGLQEGTVGPVLTSLPTTTQRPKVGR
jgi:hypothetical protein